MKKLNDEEIQKGLEQLYPLILKENRRSLLIAKYNFIKEKYYLFLTRKKSSNNHSFELLEMELNELSSLVSELKSLVYKNAKKNIIVKSILVAFFVSLFIPLLFFFSNTSTAKT